MKTLRQTYLGANEIRFADPDNFANTMALKLATQPKKAGSRNVFNAASQMTAVRQITLPAVPNCDTCVVDQERISATFRISGSTTSKEEVQLLIEDMKNWLAVATPDLIMGFLPIGKEFPLSDLPVSE